MKNLHYEDSEIVVETQRADDWQFGVLTISTKEKNSDKQAVFINWNSIYANQFTNRRGSAKHYLKPGEECFLFPRVVQSRKDGELTVMIKELA